MSLEYVLLGIIAVIAAQQAVALSTIQRQVTENRTYFEKELKSILAKLHNHIHAESDDGK